MEAFELGQITGKIIWIGLLIFIGYKISNYLSKKKKSKFKKQSN